MSLSVGTGTRSMMISLTSRLLVAYLIYRLSAGQQVVESAPADTIGASGKLDHCTAGNVQQAVQQFKGDKESVGQAAKQLYEQCSSEFLEHNPISADVKQTVDSWLGSDLSEAPASELFMLYQQALLNSKPTETSAKFTEDCKKMIQSYIRFGRITSPLTERIDINMNLLLAGGGEISSEDRKLLNYAQYTMFCDALAQQ